MQEVFENIIEKLEKKVETAKRIMVPEIHDELDRIANETAESFIEAYKESIEIVKQVVVEYNNGWIPCSECLPENISTVVVQVKEIEKPTFGWFGNMTGWRLTEKDFTELKDFIVVAWQPLPDQYHPKGEYHERKTTNADQIRSMSDKELAEFLERFGSFNHPCSINKGEPLKWLHSEVEE